MTRITPYHTVSSSLTDDPVTEEMTTFTGETDAFGKGVANDTGNETSTCLPCWWFGQVVPIVILVFGVIGNFCTTVVLKHPKYGKISTFYYMKALAWSDNFVMILLFVRWLSRVPGSPMVRDTTFCVLYFFSVRFGFGMSAWTLMFMTVDRYISVKWPLKAAELCTIRRARISLVAIALVHIFGHLPYFWRYSNPSALTLSQQCPYDLPEAFVTTYAILRMVVFDRLLPWLLTLGFTVVMSWELYRDLKTSQGTLGTIAPKVKLSRRVTAMSLIVSWGFFFLTFPTSIDYGMRVLEYVHGKMLHVSAFLYDLWVYLLYLNSALNFYLYVMGSARFRKDFVDMLRAYLARRGMKNASVDTAIPPAVDAGATSTNASSSHCDRRDIYQIYPIDETVNLP